MHLLIREDDLVGREIAELLQAHLDEARRYSPPESAHALDIDGLRSPAVTFWTVWLDRTLLGCGALKELSPDHGEIKSMHTAHTHRGKGVGAHLLSHILDEAKARSYRRVSLETGSMASFAPARALYARFGFESCAPFADYHEDPNSVFMAFDLFNSP